MKLLPMLSLSVAVLASTTFMTNAFAQDMSRTDDVPTYQEPVARNNSQAPDSGEGADMSGTNQSGRHAVMRNDMSKKPQPCVGPASFCNIYFGS
jgi:hypothetical protein